MAHSRSSRGWRGVLRWESVRRRVLRGKADEARWSRQIGAWNLARRRHDRRRLILRRQHSWRLPRRWKHCEGEARSSATFQHQRKRRRYGSFLHGLESTGSPRYIEHNFISNHGIHPTVADFELYIELGQTCNRSKVKPHITVQGWQKFETTKVLHLPKTL